MTWDQLLSIAEVNAEELDRVRNTPPADCPICGSPLDEARSVLHCPMGHWEAPSGTPQLDD